MLTCTFDDGDTWLLLWLLASLIVAILGLLLLYVKTVQINSYLCSSK
nr:MAG: E5_DELTA [Pan paniscus papillomavirus 1]